MGDYNNAVNTETGFPRKTFCFSGPLQSKLLAKEFQDRIMEELIRAHYEELRAR